MGYNLTRHVIRRNRPQLDQLYELKESVRFHTSNPVRLAYKIREAIAACGEFEELEDYFTVLSCYTIRAESQAVVASYSEVHVGVPLGEVPRTEDPEPVEQSKRSDPEALGLVDVLAELVGNVRIEEVHFPNVRLAVEDKLKLFKWTEESEWSYIDHEDRGITVTGIEVPSGLAWSPEDED